MSDQRVSAKVNKRRHDEEPKGQQHKGEEKMICNNKKTVQKGLFSTKREPEVSGEESVTKGSKPQDIETKVTAESEPPEKKCVKQIASQKITDAVGTGREAERPTQQLEPQQVTFHGDTGHTRDSSGTQVRHSAKCQFSMKDILPLEKTSVHKKLKNQQKRVVAGNTGKTLEADETEIIKSPEAKTFECAEAERSRGKETSPQPESPNYKAALTTTPARQHMSSQPIHTTDSQSRGCEPAETQHLKNRKDQFTQSKEVTLRDQLVKISPEMKPSRKSQATMKDGTQHTPQSPSLGRRTKEDVPLKVKQDKHVSGIRHETEPNKSSVETDTGSAHDISATGPIDIKTDKQTKEAEIKTEDQQHQVSPEQEAAEREAVAQVEKVKTKGQVVKSGQVPNEDHTTEIMLEASPTEDKTLKLVKSKYSQASLQPHGRIVPTGMHKAGETELSEHDEKLIKRRSQINVSTAQENKTIKESTQEQTERKVSGGLTIEEIKQWEVAPEKSSAEEAQCRTSDKVAESKTPKGQEVADGKEHLAQIKSRVNEMEEKEKKDANVSKRTAEVRGDAAAEVSPNAWSKPESLVTASVGQAADAFQPKYRCSALPEATSEEAKDGQFVKDTSRRVTAERPDAKDTKINEGLTQGIPLVEQSSTKTDMTIKQVTVETESEHNKAEEGGISNIICGDASTHMSKDKLVSLGQSTKLVLKEVQSKTVTVEDGHVVPFEVTEDNQRHGESRFSVAPTMEAASERSQIVESDTAKWQITPEELVRGTLRKGAGGSVRKNDTETTTVKSNDPGQDPTHKLSLISEKQTHEETKAKHQQTPPEKPGTDRSSTVQKQSGAKTTVAPPATRINTENQDSRMGQGLEQGRGPAALKEETKERMSSVPPGLEVLLEGFKSDSLCRVLLPDRDLEGESREVSLSPPPSTKQTVDVSAETPLITEQDVKGFQKNLKQTQPKVEETAVKTQEMLVGPLHGAPAGNLSPVKYEPNQCKSNTVKPLILITPKQSLDEKENQAPLPIAEITPPPAKVIPVEGANMKQDYSTMKEHRKDFPLSGETPTLMGDTTASSAEPGTKDDVRDRKVRQDGTDTQQTVAGHLLVGPMSRKEEACQMRVSGDNEPSVTDQTKHSHTTHTTENREGASRKWRLEAEADVQPRKMEEAPSVIKKPQGKASVSHPQTSRGIQAKRPVHH